jgi:hypothetical protein
MASNNITLLECPLCDFSVLPSDDYVLQLHFEQVHTDDSPFRIHDDPEQLPPSLPPRPSSQQPQHVDEGVASDSEDEDSVLCPESDCGEIVPLSDFNDHLDLHAAETLSFDDTTGKYHSRQPTNMKALSNNNHTSNLHDPSFLEQNFDTAIPEALRRNDDPGRKLKKKIERGRGDSTGSEKSTLARSIAAFNPFSRGKLVKGPKNSVRLGVSHVTQSQLLCKY